MSKRSRRTRTGRRVGDHSMDLVELQRRQAIERETEVMRVHVERLEDELLTRINQEPRQREGDGGEERTP